MYSLLSKKVNLVLFALTLIKTIDASEIIKLSPIALRDDFSFFSGPSFSSSKLVTKEEESFLYGSIDDLIESEFNIDIQQRGLFAVQSELNIRASSFEQSLVVVDGVNLSDPQTSHFSMDLPLSNYDWQSIKVLKGSSSSLYGSHAIGGVLDIETVSPRENNLRVSSTFGEKQLRVFDIALDRVSEPLNYHLSIQQSSSASYREETDFSSFNIFSKFIFNEIFGSPKVVLAHNSKKFGASSFYSSSYPREEENIDTELYIVNFDFIWNNFAFSPILYFRRHWDKFILDRSNPDLFKNVSTNYIRGIKLPFSFAMLDTGIDLSLEVREEEIDSTNMGKHSRSLFSLSTAASKELSDRLSCLISFRIDNYSGLDIEVSPGLYLEYRLTEDKGIFSSFQRAYRVPSFTELYYSSPANIGNLSLSVEDSFSIELGYLKKGILSYGASVFRRFDYNLIDWARNSTSDAWRAQNVSYAKTDGIEGWLSYDDFKFSYALFDAEHKSRASYSKYIANYLQYNFSVSQKIETDYFNINLGLSYQERVKNSGFFNLDVVLFKEIILKGNSVDLYLKFMNLTNASKSDIGGVPLPGRWVSMGIAMAF
ncbi:MAG: TonB-dependent receptor [Candidatus Kaelpia imicola]|nr:TonB-dependent receptor [Candidatus Kaelpia imicola]